MPNDTFGINDNLKNMQKEFSFFLLWVKAIGSGNKHVFHDFEIVTILKANGDLVPGFGDLHISSWN